MHTPKGVSGVFFKVGGNVCPDIERSENLKFFSGNSTGMPFLPDAVPEKNREISPEHAVQLAYMCGKTTNTKAWYTFTPHRSNNLEI